MSIKEAFSFKGRISRMNYFLYQLLVGIPIIFLQVLQDAFFTGKIFFSLIILAFEIPLVIILICKSIQRLHDINLPGIITLAPFIITFLNAISPNYNFIPFIYVFHGALLIIKGHEDSNKYGEAPLE